MYESAEAIKMHFFYCYRLIKVEGPHFSLLTFFCRQSISSYLEEEVITYFWLLFILLFYLFILIQKFGYLCSKFQPSNSIEVCVFLRDVLFG